MIIVLNAHLYLLQNGAPEGPNGAHRGTRNPLNSWWLCSVVFLLFVFLLVLGGHLVSNSPTPCPVGGQLLTRLFSILCGVLLICLSLFFGVFARCIYCVGLQITFWGAVRASTFCNVESESVLALPPSLRNRVIMGLSSSFDLFPLQYCDASEIEFADECELWVWRDVDIVGEVVSSGIPPIPFLQFIAAVTEQAAPRAPRETSTSTRHLPRAVKDALMQEYPFLMESDFSQPSKPKKLKVVGSEDSGRNIAF